MATFQYQPEGSDERWSVGEYGELGEDGVS